MLVTRTDQQREQVEHDQAVHHDACGQAGDVARQSQDEVVRDKKPGVGPVRFFNCEQDDVEQDRQTAQRGARHITDADNGQGHRPDPERQSEVRKQSLARYDSVSFHAFALLAFGVVFEIAHSPLPEFFPSGFRVAEGCSGTVVRLSLLTKTTGTPFCRESELRT